MTKRRPLALGAAAAIGFGSLFFATPAAFAQEEVEQPIVDQTEEQAQAETATEATAEAKPDAQKAVKVQPDEDSQEAIEFLEDLEDVTGESVFAFGTDAGNTRTLLADINAPEDVKAELVAAVEADKSGNFDRVAFGEPAVPYAATDVTGGAGYYSYQGDAIESGCSFGFSAFDGNGAPVMLTAGHCAKDGALDNIQVQLPSDARAAGGGFIGTTNGTGVLGQFGFSQYGGPGNEPGPAPGSAPLFEAPEGVDATFTDIGVIENIGDQFDLLPAVTDWSTADQEDLSLGTTKITAAGDPRKGNVSKSGATTGDTDGDTVVEGVFKDQNNNYVDVEILDGYLPIGGRWVHGFLSDAYGQPGDSGGAVYQGNTAVGLVSGGPEDGSYLWATRLLDGIEQTDDSYEVALHIDAPEVVSHQNGAVLEPGETIRGTAASNATDFSYSFQPNAGSGGQVQDGKWSFQAPQEPGEYTATIGTSNGHSRSESVTLTFTVEAAAVAAPAITSPANGSTVEAPVTEITGTGVAGATLNMTGDVTSEVEVGEDGNWSVPTDLAEGEYTVLVTQTVEGETSREVTSSFTVVKKDEPPVDKVEIAVTSIEDGAEYTLANAPTSVSGTATPGATVTGSLDADNGEFKAVADAKGNWSADLGYKPALGAYTLEATASLDGETSKTVTVDFTIVESNGSGGGGDDNGKGNGGGDDDLAATGFDIVSMAPYIAGAALMALLGAAAILVAARRQKGLTDEN